MSSGKDGENAGSVDGDGRELIENGIISRHQYDKDCGDLKYRGHFAHETWMNFWTMIGEEQHEKTYQDDDIPSDDDDREPAGKHFDDGEGDECRGEEELVSDRIEISTQFSSFVSNPRNHAIDSIRNPCDRKSNEGTPKRFINDQDDKEWNQKDPCEGHNIRQIH